MASLRGMMADVLIGRVSPEIIRVRRVVDQLLTGERDARQFLVELQEFQRQDDHRLRWAGLRCTYFIRMEVPGVRRRPIKIGRAHDPERRRYGLLNASPYPLTLLAAVPFFFLPEPTLHTIFSKQRMGGEWFKPAAGILQLIDECQTFVAAQDARWPWTPPKTWDELLERRREIEARVG